MLQLPPEIAIRYRPATDRDVHSRSFGQLKAPRNPEATSWKERRGTLDDQAIFGPLQDFECACGKYRGPKHQNMVCDRCGVKVTVSAARSHRFGHIDLPSAIVHPIAPKSERLTAVPVLPAAFFESRAGKALADIYNELLRSVLSESVDGVVGNFNRLVELLLPVAIAAHEWDLREAEVLAFGFGLVPHDTSANGTCDNCHYPLEGLNVLYCPGCGKKLSQLR